MGDGDAPLGEDQLEVSEAQAEEVVQRDDVADDLGREAVAGIGGGLGRHPTFLPQPLCSGQSQTT
jgi:hypothetical protein